MSDDNIPEKLDKETLSKLPIGQLLSMKGVPRSVKESPDFVKMHLEHSIETTSNHSLILVDCQVSRKGRLHTADFDSVNNTNTAVFREGLGIPITLRGSCNGLLCLSNANDVIFVWNPSTNKFKKLPYQKIAPAPRAGFRKVFMGFGYDSVNDDYKVVRIVHFIHQYCVLRGTEVKVCSLKSNSWKRVRNIPRQVKEDRGKLANNALHWVVYGKDPSENNRDGVEAFDFATQKFSKVALPQFSDGHFSLELAVLKSCLCVTGYFNDPTDIWVRGKTGDQYNWSKLVSISISEPDKFQPHLRPIAYSKCGKRLLLQEALSRLLWYDLEERTVTYVTAQNSAGEDFEYFELDICVHSLVQPHRGNSSKKRKRVDSPERASS